MILFIKSYISLQVRNASRNVAIYQISNHLAHGNLLQRNASYLYNIIFHSKFDFWFKIPLNYLYLYYNNSLKFLMFRFSDTSFIKIGMKSVIEYNIITGYPVNIIICFKFFNFSDTPLMSKSLFCIWFFTLVYILGLYSTVYANLIFLIQYFTI